MNRDFHFRLADQYGNADNEYKTRLRIAPTGINVDVHFPGEEMPRCVWIEAHDHGLIVRTYDPDHEGPKTTVILADSQYHHSDGYD